MKKTLAFLMCIVILVSFSVTAYAADGLTITEAVIFEMDNDDTAYFFARVENTGDRAIGVGSGKLVGFSADDDLLVTEDYISSQPEDLLLEPGEYAYIREFIWDDALESDDIADYKFSLKESSYPEATRKLPCEAIFRGEDSYNSYIFVTFTNETEEIVFSPAVTVAMFDTNGKLIYVDGEEYYELGVHPGSTVTIAVPVDSDMIKYYANHGIEIGEVEGIVYEFTD